MFQPTNQNREIRNSVEARIIRSKLSNKDKEKDSNIDNQNSNTDYVHELYEQFKEIDSNGNLNQKSSY